MTEQRTPPAMNMRAVERALAALEASWAVAQAGFFSKTSPEIPHYWRDQVFRAVTGLRVLISRELRQHVRIGPNPQTVTASFQPAPQEERLGPDPAPKLLEDYREASAVYVQAVEAVQSLIASRRGG